MDYKSKTFRSAVKRLEARLMEWKEQGLRVALFGAGRHTGEVAALISLKNLADFIVDDNPALLNGSVAGLRVVDSNSIKTEQPDRIAICSFYHQEDILDNLINMPMPSEIIYRMYTEEDLMEMVSRFSYNINSSYCGHQTDQTPGPGYLNTRWKHARINKIALVHPPFATSNHRHKKTMPMGLLALGAWIRKNFPDISLDLIDAHIMDMTPLEVLSQITSGKHDMVCLTGWTAQMPAAYHIADEIRKSGQALVVMGGVHATLCHEETIEHADIVIKGEGELPLKDLLTRLQNANTIENLNTAKIRPGQETEFKFIENLDILPLPAWDLLPNWKLYDHPLHVVGGFRFPIMGSRGCPFNCTFCSSPLMWQRKVRWNSPEWIVRQMETIKKEYGVSKFHFWDDNMILVPKHIRQLCQLILAGENTYEWVGLSRASDINRNSDVLPLMKQAGCVGIEIGVESFTQVSADMVKKGEQVEGMIEASGNLIANDIVPLYTHMLFTPGETLNSYPKKQEFMSRLNSLGNCRYRSDGELGQLTTPHRKTAFADDAPLMGEVFAENNEDFNHHRVNFIPNSLLNDVPSKIAPTPGSPYPFLHTIVSYVHNWTIEDMKDYILIGRILWPLINGDKSIRDLVKCVNPEVPRLSNEKIMIFVTLNTVGWAKRGKIKGIEYDKKRKPENITGKSALV